MLQKPNCCDKLNLLNRSFQGFDAGVAVDTPDRWFLYLLLGIAIVLSVLP